MGKRKILPTTVVTLLLLSILTNGMIIMIPLVKITEAADITSWLDTNTTINVTVVTLEPRINWYDFQNSSSFSKLNSWIDVEEQYKFCVNITSDQGWADVDYINITAWYDNGSESTTYNNSGNLGGNLNMFLQYENATGTANWSLLWPDDEVIFNAGDCTETVISANTHNLTFVFTPRNQTRYAPGDGGWDTNAGHNDTKSWNFNITAEDSSGYKSYEIDEYGIYMYSHITQVTDNPFGSGAPGDNNIQLSPNATVTTQCNANYSLSTNFPNLTRAGGGYWILNTSLSAAGGNLSRINFDGSNPLYIWGTNTTYRPHLNNTYADIVNVTYWVNITIGTLPGNYSSTITYTLNGQV
ncbi:MAG: hypothetical protein JSW60_06175 [Thermoplasmatales archaeon]|nr:MAG: hypothetical protein JSW60_06175 [Thermoplasmatales archaeon]